MEIGIVGLGKMGDGLAARAIEKGFRVVGVDKKMKSDLTRMGVETTTKLAELAARLARPRVILVYIPAGPGIDRLLEQLMPLLDAGDVIVDGGNSHYGDSIRRHRGCQEAGLFFVDCGTSGGPEGARHGACFMVGGDKQAMMLVRPVLTRLAAQDGFVQAGPTGAGHFVKLVHNAIEFGMLQSIGEGVALLEKGPYKLDLRALFSNWNHGSVIQGRLVELMAEQLRRRSLNKVPAVVEDTGEVNWVIEEALRMEVPIPAISTAVMELFASRDDRNSAWRSIAMMRHAFGGHPFGHNAMVRKERRTGKVNPEQKTA